jgi:hypothetical protein
VSARLRSRVSSSVCSGLDGRLDCQLAGQERHQHGPRWPVGSLDDPVRCDNDQDRRLAGSRQEEVPIRHSNW